MAFYIKILFLLGLLTLSACFSHKLERKTWTEKLFDDVKEANESEYLFRNEKQKLITYAFCEEKDDDMIFRYPCELDPAYISRIKKKAYSYDSTTGLKISVQSLYYAAYVVDHRVVHWRSDTLSPLFGIMPTKSGVRVKNDGSMESYCASADSAKCSYLFAEIQISKKLTDKWNALDVYDVLVDSSFESSFSTNAMLEEIIKSRAWDKGGPNTVPYELCWQNEGFSIPCHLDSTTKALIDEYVSSIENGRLVMISFGTFALENTIPDAVVSAHFCRSDDGIHCKEGWIFIENKEKNLELHQIDLEKGLISRYDYPIYDKFLESWVYRDEQNRYKKVYNETGQIEHDLKYYGSKTE